MPKPMAPGTILQLCQLRRRLKSYNKEKIRFLDVGCGEGIISNLFLQAGHEGTGIDLGEQACRENEKINNFYIKKGKYKIVLDDFLAHKFNTDYDIIISSCVLEHLDKDDVTLFLSRCYENLLAKGVLVLLLPSNVNAWGIEDEIAGHFRRYSKKHLNEALSISRFKSTYFSYLNFPISNMLLPLSNYLVSKHESNKLKEDMQSNTISSGSRSVIMKTIFPNFLKYIVNMYTLYPLDILQRIFSSNSSSLMLYSEAQKND